jgi:nucleoside-diphosphate-sugar epimerase
VRVFVAGASGVLGVRLVPLLVARGHTVAGMTRSPSKAPRLQTLGAQPVVCDVYDGDRLTDEVTSFDPDLVMHQLTDLPDDPRVIPQGIAANSRMRTEGTRNLIAAAEAAAANRFVAQSVAWTLAGDGAAAKEELERSVLAVNGTVLRYGRFYGEGTYYEHAPPPPPRIQIDDAAMRTADAVCAPPGIVTIAES